MRSRPSTRRAAAHCRAGLGPYLLECKTFRMTGHSAHDAASYVPKGLFEEWRKLDPIPRLETKMLEQGWADQAELNAARAAVIREVEYGTPCGRADPMNVTGDRNELTAHHLRSDHVERSADR